MKVDDPTVSDTSKPWLKSPFWVTLGGKIEKGEDVVASARRELLEETGLNADLGPVVWYGEQILEWKGERTLMRESFIVATTHDSDIADDGRTTEEKNVILETRWWTIDELEKTKEVILPVVLRKLIRSVAFSDYPKQIAVIDLSSS